MKVRDMVGRRIRYNGQDGTVTLQRNHSLADDVSGTAAALEVGASALAGATQILVRGTGLSGSVPAGLVVTVGGQDYLVSSDATASDHEITLDLTAGLAASVAESDPVTVSPAVLEFFAFEPASRRGLAVGTSEEFGQREIWLYSEDHRPRVGDLLLEADGATEMVVRFRRLSGRPETPVAWRVEFGSERAI